MGRVSVAMEAKVEEGKVRVGICIRMRTTKLYI